MNTVPSPIESEPIGGIPPAGGTAQTAIEAAREMERRARSGQLDATGMAAWAELKRRKGITDDQLGYPDTPGTMQYTGVDRPIGVVATGFNKGIGSFVDLLNQGLKAIGLPMSDEPFMGTAFIDKYLAGAQFVPQHPFEQVLQRAGFEVGATVPLLAGSLAARGAKIAAGETLARKMPTGTTIEAIKNIPGALVEQMTQVSAAKLAAIETALAAGAGTGASIVHQVFPEGGPTADFFGELLGSFAPSVVIGLLQKAQHVGAAAAGFARRAIGLETEAETKSRLAENLSPAAKPEDIKAGVTRAEELRREVSPSAAEGEGLELSAGEAIGKGVADTQRALERRGGSFRTKAIERRQQNIEAVKQYFDATAPEGNPTRLIEQLEAQRRSNELLLQQGLARTQAKIDAVKGDLSARAARLLNSMEERMWAADQRVEARLAAIGSKLSPKERGQIIRQEYDAELTAFRERSRADYHELDMLGHAEIPVDQTLQKLAALNQEFPAQLQIIRKLNPRVAEVLDQLGHDYELVLRAQKAQADLGIRDASGPGTRVFLEQAGRGSTPEVRGLSRGTPDWYRSLTLRKENPLTREQIEARLDRWASGLPHDPNNPTDMEIVNALRNDREFARSPYNEPVLAELGETPSAGLRDLRQVRSDLLALSRKAKATDDRVQRYVLHELIGAIDADIDRLLPGQSRFADLYPEHGALYREISADYRAGVETLMKGTANKLRLQNRYGDYTIYDDDVAAMFFRNESTLADFQRAFPNRSLAHAALRDYALEDFMRAAIHKKGGQWVLNRAAYDEWMKDHEAHLAAFPDLKPVFQNTARLMDEAAVLREQVEAFRGSTQAEERLLRRLHAERRPGELTTADVSAAEARLKHVQEVLERSQHEWEHSLAGLFLKENPNYAAARLVTAKDPIKEYEALYAKVQRDPEAVAGLNKAIWNALTDKIQPRLIGMTGTMNLGVFHRELQQWIFGHEQLMTRVLGAEGMQRIKNVADVIEKIARGGKEGSDTAINLQVQAALASTWLSRAFAVASGRVSHVFAGAERAGQLLTKYFQSLTQKQQDAILLESFFNPKVYETLVLAAQYGPKNDIVQHRTRVALSLLNLSEHTAEER